MLRVHLEKFRGFQHSPWLEIKPITFLVGENSAGKTSFLAAVRFLLESFSRSSDNPFNRDPYFLGGFEQIAYSRAGSEKSETFSLSIEIPATGITKKVLRNPARHRFTFNRGFPQPEILDYEFSSGGAKISLNMAEESVKPKMTINSKTRSDAKADAKEENHNIVSRAKNMPPSSFLRQNPFYFRVVMQELIYGLERSIDDPFEEMKSSRLLHRKAKNSLSKLNEDFLSSMRALSRNVFASAPVRTQPRRTYNPSEVILSSEGSHVPLELSRIKRQEPAQWLKMKKALERFGRNSGLFASIDVRHLGKSDYDPFQVIVRTNGSQANLVDVGYGVSQVLPIVYQLYASAKYDAFLLQQPEVHLHPRAQAEIGTLVGQVANAEKEGSFFVIETHSDYVIDRVRIEVAKKKVSHSDVTIIFFQNRNGASIAHNLYLNKSGEIVNPPEGFRDFFLEEHSRLLGLK